MTKQEWQIEVEEYDRLLELPYSSWAWEFKRRDPMLIQDYQTQHIQIPVLKKLENNLKLFQLIQKCDIAEKYGLHFLPDPHQSALEIAPFWVSELLHFSFDATAETIAHNLPSNALLNWKQLPGDKSLLITPQCKSNLSITSGGYTTQLEIEDQSTPILKTNYVSLRVGIKHLLNENLIHFQHFSDYCNGLKITPNSKRGYSPINLRNALIALDGWLQKITQRDISSALFGKQASQNDWDRGIFSLKSRTRRLINKGRKLMEKEYLNLL